MYILCLYCSAQKSLLEIMSDTEGVFSVNYYCASLICPRKKTVDLYAISSLWRNRYVIWLILRTPSQSSDGRVINANRYGLRPPMKTKNRKLLMKILPHCPQAQQPMHTPWAALGGMNKIDYFISASNCIQGYDYWEGKVRYVIFIYYS